MRHIKHPSAKIFTCVSVLLTLLHTVPGKSARAIQLVAPGVSVDLDEELINAANRHARAQQIYQNVTRFYTEERERDDLEEVREMSLGGSIRTGLALIHITREKLRIAEEFFRIPGGDLALARVNEYLQATETIYQELGTYASLPREHRRAYIQLRAPLRYLQTAIRSLVEASRGFRRS